jgi:hypothetical protein
MDSRLRGNDERGTDGFSVIAGMTSEKPMDSRLRGMTG